MNFCKILTLTCAMLFCIAHVWSRDSINGKYYNESFKYVTIHNDTLTLRRQAETNWEPIFYSDTLAYCKLIYCGGDLYEVNSIDDKILKCELDSIIASRHSKRNLVIVSIPAKYTKYRVLLTFESKGLIHSLDFKVENGYGQCVIPLKDVTGVRDAIISIYPEDYPYELLENTYRGRMCENIPVKLFLNKKGNTMLMTIKNLDDSYFERQYVRGEYIRIKNDSLFWRGSYYIKKE